MGQMSDYLHKINCIAVSSKNSPIGKEARNKLCHIIVWYPIINYWFLSCLINCIITLVNSTLNLSDPFSFLSFFLSFFLSYPDIFLPTHRRWRGSLLHLITHNDTHVHREDSSGRRIGPSQRPLPIFTKDRLKSPPGFDPPMLVHQRQQTYALNSAVTVIGGEKVSFQITCVLILHGVTNQKTTKWRVITTKTIKHRSILFPQWLNITQWATAPSLTSFTITLKHTTVGRSPLDEWSARRRNPWQYNKHKRQKSIPPVGFENSIPASERPQTHALDRAGHWNLTDIFRLSQTHLWGLLRHLTHT